MNLLSTSFWSFLSTIIRLFSGLIITKIFAVYIGPAGVAIMGNFNNVLSMLNTLASGATGSGVTKYISEASEEKEKHKVTFHAMIVTFISSFICGIATFVLSDYLARNILHDSDYNYIFEILGSTIFFFGVNTITLSILNGYRNIKTLTYLSIFNSLISVSLSYLITTKYGIHGALINSSVGQILTFILTVIIYRKIIIRKINSTGINIEKKIFINLLKYSAMALVSIAIVPTTLIIIRKIIISEFSLREAGYIQGLWDVSTAYLAIITTTLSVYYLPTLSSIKSQIDLRNEIIRGYKYLIPSVFILTILIFINRELIITLLYTPAFLPMKKLFLVQLIGDIFKISSWLLGFLMIAKAMTRLFIITELIFSGSYLLLSLLFINNYGIVGVTYAYAINYFIYLTTLIFIFRKLLFNSKNNSK